MKIIDYLKTNVNELLNSEKISFELGGQSLTYTVREPSAGHQLGIEQLDKVGKDKDAAAYMIGACVFDETGAHIFDYQSDILRCYGHVLRLQRIPGSRCMMSWLYPCPRLRCGRGTICSGTRSMNTAENTQER